MKKEKEKCPICGEEMHEGIGKLPYGKKETTYLVCENCGYGVKKEVLYWRKNIRSEREW